MFNPNLIELGAVSDVKHLLVLVIGGFILWLFVIWYESLKDGFDTDKIFDISFWVLSVYIMVFWFLVMRIRYFEIYDPTIWVLKNDKFLMLSLIPYIFSLIPIYLFVKKYKWSLYRILDIYTVGYYTLINFYILFHLLVYKDLRALIALVFGFFIYLFVFRFRGYKFFSGFIFSCFLVLISVGGFIFYRPYGYLLFYLVPFTMGLTVFYFRSKKIMILDANLPANLLKNLKDKLTKKEKQLKKEQELLKAEDDFLKVDRVSDNSEELDEAILEDNAKELTDLKMNSIRVMRVQIRKALAFMKIGKYGVCESCGTPIDKARLKIYPEATKCIDCSHKADN